MKYRLLSVDESALELISAVERFVSDLITVHVFQRHIR